MVVLRVLLPIADVGMGQLLKLVKAVIVYPVRGQPEPLADDLPLRVGQQVIGGIVDQRHGGHQVAGAHAVVLFAADFPVLALADGHHQVNGVAGIDRVAGLGVELDRGHAVPPADLLPAVALVPRLAGGRNGSGARLEIGVSGVPDELLIVLAGLRPASHVLFAVEQPGMRAQQVMLEGNVESARQRRRLLGGRHRRHAREHHRRHRHDRNESLHEGLLLRNVTGQTHREPGEKGMPALRRMQHAFS